MTRRTKWAVRGREWLMACIETSAAATGQRLPTAAVESRKPRPMPIHLTYLHLFIFFARLPELHVLFRVHT
ncbi:hypothetical protein CKAH01_12126 [Colletotrichum kahawae]|uniref:Uncharacterized protein n=1 Tax=Colletotrichum kahawae TaxID=34407 RepID=A0AAE0DD38_COLKA|nr:hypothetical protein CKAH01_12126 [Colletotrichum kahawae]